MKQKKRYEKRYAMDAMAAEAGIRKALTGLGFDVAEAKLNDAPRRVIAAWDEMLSGYYDDPATILSKTFEDGEDYDQAVCLRDIEFVSLCEHHLLPFTGVAHVAYVPNPDKKVVVGLSKLARLVDCYSRRLQVQERMTTQIAKAMNDHLAPVGVAVVVEAAHQCMTCRGVRKSSAVMVTSKLTGCFYDKPEARAEVMALLLGGRP